VPAGRRCKYVNRLVPVVDVDKATEAGMERVGRDVLGAEFELKKEDGEKKKEGEDAACTVSDGLQVSLFLTGREWLT
jgi:hypothetical protein